MDRSPLARMGERIRLARPHRSGLPVSIKHALYVVSPPGPSRDSLLAALGGEAVPFDSVEALGALGDLSPGVVLVDSSAVSAGEALTLASLAATSGPGWCVALMRNGVGETNVQTISIGPKDSLEEVGAFARDPSGHRQTLLELRRVLRDAGQLRHDLNNPLTVALAQTQVLLMDDHGDQVREPLEAIQAQLCRIRDIIVAAKHLRTPNE